MYNELFEEKTIGLPMVFLRYNRKAGQIIFAVLD